MAVSGHVTDGTNHSNWFITDNNISGFTRMGIELQTNSGAVGGVHVDRNTINETQTTGMRISAVAMVSNNACDTVWGNTLNGVAGNNQWSIEIYSNAGPIRLSVEHNIITNVDSPMQIAAAVDAEIENNNMTNFGNNPP